MKYTLTNREREKTQQTLSLCHFARALSPVRGGRGLSHPSQRSHNRS